MCETCYLITILNALYKLLYLEKFINYLANNDNKTAISQ